jgi:gentisate 1,2-dioxygenase
MENELELFESQLEKEHTRGLWREVPADSPGESRGPKPLAQPYVWKWEKLSKLLEQAVSVVQIDRASERRVLQLRNPGLSRGTTLTLNGCLQILCPGENAPTHRHTAAAIRFIIKGHGAYTVVNGERITMAEGDLVLTPAMTWHDHGSESSTPVIWFDGLDAPFVSYLNLSFFDGYSSDKQPITKAEALTTKTLGSGGLRPSWLRPKENVDLPFIYPWKETYDALSRLAALEGEGDPFDGIILDYGNPVTGGPTLRTLGCQVQLLRPGERTRAHRHTSSVVYLAFRGSGSIIVDDQRLDWAQGDAVVLPSWSWHQFINPTSSEAILFSINDRPILEPLGLYREETKPEA